MRIKPPLAPVPPLTSPAPISAVEIGLALPDKPESGQVWVGHTNGEMFRSLDARADQPTFTPARGQESPLPRRFVTRIRVLQNPGAEAAAATLLVMFGGFARDNLWQSDDDGQSWRNIHGNLPAAPVFDVTRHPRNRTWLYAATDLGVFASTDGGSSWLPTSSGPSFVRATQMLWMGERLLVSTFGRGLHWIDLSGLGPADAGPATPPSLPSPAREPASTPVPQR